MNTKKMNRLNIVILYLCFMLEAVPKALGKNENSQPEQEDTLTDSTVSFGIRSFTVEVTTPTQKSKLASQNDSFSISNHTNADETISPTTLISTRAADGGEHIISTLMNMTTNNNVEVTTIIPGLSIESVTHKSSPQLDIVFSTESDIEQKVHEEETTDERPPSLPSSSILSTSTPSQAEKVSEYITSTQQVMINDIHVEEKLENGLYRIKLAEIITDEFHGGSSDEASSSINDNISTGSINVDKNDISNAEPYQQTQSIGGKINIIDLYPSKLEDFSPIIKESNEKIIKDKQIYLNEDHNMFPNSLNQIFDDVDTENSQPPTSNIDIELIDEGRDVININEDLSPGKSINTNNNIENQTKTVNSSKRSSIIDDRVTDFTGKLQEQDGVITEIEKKFRLDDLKRSTAIPITVNHRLDFIDRRVKKNDPFMSKFKFYNSDGTLGRIDFANTKFNTDTSISNKNVEEKDKKLLLPIDKPEFSTTKFYNSKELYNEMIHKKYDTETFQSINSKKIELGTPTPGATTIQPEGKVLKNTAKSNKSEKSTDGIKEEKTKPETNTPHGILESSTPKSKIQTTAGIGATTVVPDNENGKIPESTIVKNFSSPANNFSGRKKAKSKSRIAPTAVYTSGNKIVSVSTTIATTSVPASTIKVSQKQKEIPGARHEIITAIRNSSQGQSRGGRAKNNTKTTPSLTLSTTTLVTTTVSSQPLFAESHINTERAPSKEIKPTVTTLSPTRSKIIDDLSQHHSASTKASAATPTIRKPFSRPRVLTRLQEKINSLECEIQNMPPESHLWRGNETHELFLPITTPEDCSRSNEKCTPVIISWEGQVEIQSGDVLLVEINDALLLPVDYNQTHDNTSHKATTAVYQVTRPGHEHCDVTEGVLLDITPLVVDGRKLVTLYDKDLTEGVNLLIVVSELWRSQCVRLKVTVKSDNCGENADCSGKGVCFSNASMEGYECQCCSGFAGSHCEEIDACSPSPCTNNGICVDLSQGHEGNAYQCLCPYGFTGKNCQYESDPCNPTDCMNGGSCVGNATHFRCDCAPGYTGPLCQHNLNECESTPCVHGICVDEEDGFRCFCQPGFSGELCNFEYNECESNPCLNGGQCNDQIGGFECKCTRGYTGNRCHIKVEFCANGPCPEGHRCIDRGDDFTCECPGGRNGPDCNQVPRTQCTVNPCANGGTCWTSEESFYCACRPGYTGKMCEDEFVVETVVSSSEFMTDDTSARGAFNDKGFGAAVAKAPIELHNAYIAAGTLAAAIFIVAIVVTICHCKVHQTYRRFSTRHHQLIPIFGFGRRNKSPKSHRHWLSGKGSGGGGNPVSGGNLMGIKSSKNHLPGSSGNGPCHNHHIGGQASSFHHHHPHQIHERPFQRHLAMNLENDMYYTVDFSDSQHSPLIQ